MAYPDNDDPSKLGGAEHTRVDLGEDLLEATKLLNFKQSSANESQKNLQKAEILLNERLYSDAKQILRKLLRDDASDGQARKLLEVIHQKEIQELLNSGSSGNRLFEETENDLGAKLIQSRTIEKLDADLRLGISKIDMQVVPDLFKTSEEYLAYRETILTNVLSLSVKLRVDF